MVLMSRKSSLGDSTAVKDFSEGVMTIVLLVDFPADGGSEICSQRSRSSSWWSEKAAV
jgi:hypothetical protein